MTKTCPHCHATVLSPVDGRRPDPAAQFVMWALMEGSWQGADIDGGAAQDKAETLGLIAVTAYDPEKHGESDNAEPGDRWYVPSEKLLSALSSQDAATVLSTSQPERMDEVLRLLRKISDLAYDEDIGEPLDCAIDYANKAIAALAATPADEQFNAVLDSYADENQRLSDEIIALKAAAPQASPLRGRDSTRDILLRLSAWCAIERGNLGAIDGYDYRSGEEFGLRRAEIEIEKQYRALSASPPEQPAAATMPWIDAEEGDIS